MKNGVVHDEGRCDVFTGETTTTSPSYSRLSRQTHGWIRLDWDTAAAATTTATTATTTTAAAAAAAGAA